MIIFRRNSYSVLGYQKCMINKYEKGDPEMASPRMIPDPEPPVENKGAVERLNFNVSPTVAAETRQLADSLDISMTQLFKYAISIFKIAVVEVSKNRKLVIADENGTALREFILPEVESLREKLISHR